MGNKLDNLPPGVTDTDIPGNAPDDEEVESCIVLPVWEIKALIQAIDSGDRCTRDPIMRANMLTAIKDIVEQFGEDHNWIQKL